MNSSHRRVYVVLTKFIYCLLTILFFECIANVASALVTVGSLGSMGGFPDVEIVGNLAYAASGSCKLGGSKKGLCIFDISNPRDVLEVGFLEVSAVRELTVVDNVAYLARGSSGLTIIDVSNPANPVEIAFRDTPGSGRDIKVVNGVAYIADGYSGIRVFDVSNPTFPIDLGFYDDGIPIFHLDIKGTVLYAVAANHNVGSVAAIDISDPTSPTLISRTEFLDNPQDIQVEGNYAYLATGNGWFSVVDISDPTALRFYTGTRVADRTEGLHIVGDRAYVASATAGLAIFDIANPRAVQPRRLGTLDTPGSAHNVVYHAGMAYVSDSSTNSQGWFNDVRIIDVSVLDFPRKLTKVRALTMPTDIDISGDFAYLAMGDRAALRTFDITALPPVEVGMLDGSGANVVKVVGNIAYLGSGNLGFAKRLYAVDVSNSALPVEIGNIELPGIVGDVEISDGLAYVAARPAGLIIVDVSNPAQMEIIGHLDTNYSTTSVEIQGQIAYLGTYQMVLIIDVSDPTQPVTIGSQFMRSATVLDLDVSGNLLYAIQRGLRIIDVSNPAATKVLSDTLVADDPQKVTVRGNRAYISAKSDGVRVIDVSNPSAPFELGGIDPDQDFTQIVDAEVNAGYVYAVDHSLYYLHVFEFGPEYDSVIEVELDIKPGGEPNAIHLDEGGVIPVAILGSESFDVADVDAATLTFGPGGATLAHYRGPHPQDVNGDGRLDLVAHFRAEETGIEYGDRVACLSGKTLDGQKFEGCDSIRTVPDMDGDSLLDVDEAAIGTHPLRFDSDGDGYGDGTEVLVMGTDPLDPLDPKPVADRERRGAHKRRR